MYARAAHVVEEYQKTKTGFSCLQNVYDDEQKVDKKKNYSFFVFFLRDILI